MQTDQPQNRTRSSAARLYLVWLLAGIVLPVILVLTGHYSRYVQMGRAVEENLMLAIGVALLVILPTIITTAVFVWFNRRGGAVLRAGISAIVFYTFLPVALFFVYSITVALLSGQSPLSVLGLWAGVFRVGEMWPALLADWSAYLLKVALPACVLLLAFTRPARTQPA